MAEAAGLRLRHVNGGGVPLEMVDRDEQVGQEVCGEVARHVTTDQHPLHDGVGELTGEWVGGDLPSIEAEPIGQVVEREAGIGALLHLPRHGRDALGGVGVEDEVE